MTSVSGCSSKKHINERNVSDTTEALQSEQGKIDTSHTNTQSTKTTSADERSNNVYENTEINSTENSVRSEKENTENKKGKEDAISKTEPSKVTDTNSNASNVSENIPSEKESSEKLPDTQELSFETATLVEKLFNEERVKAGVKERTVLPGLSNVAVFRSKQLTKQFSHTWTDENGKEWDGAEYAATFLKYGEYSSVKETKYDFALGTVIETGNVIERYSYGESENCGKGSAFGMTSEELAEYIISSFKKSKGHWNSLMSNENDFEGVGITILKGEWYCSINSSKNNYG